MVLLEAASFAVEGGRANRRGARRDFGEGSRMGKLVLTLWPSFWVAAVAEVVFFTVVDPQQLYLFGQPVSYPPLATYSIGFFAFWTVCAVSSWATLFYARTAQEINHLPPKASAS